MHAIFQEYFLKYLVILLNFYLFFNWPWISLSVKVFISVFGTFFNGLVLIGDSSFFTPFYSDRSGFYVPGDAKSSVILYTDKNQLILVGQNKDQLLSFSYGQNGNLVSLDRDEKFADVFKDGVRFRKEFYYGSSFISQSSRKILFNLNVDSIYMYDSNKLNRKIIF